MHEKLRKIADDLKSGRNIPWWDIDDYIGSLRKLHMDLLDMKPKKSCQNCRFFDLTKCDKAGKIPPDEIKAKGCELFEDNIKDLMI